MKYGKPAKTSMPDSEPFQGATTISSTSTKTPSAAERERLRAIRDLLAYADVLVDGPFVQAKRSLGLKYCGSSNQRLIDMNKTRKAGRVVLWQSFEDYPTKPPSW